MRKKIPDSVVSQGHSRFVQLAGIRDELISRADGLKNIIADIPPLLREAIDVVIDTPRTGRRSYNDLEKTEKTYLGTRVEILIRSYFRLSKGALDLVILGGDADVKFTTRDNWMIPGEAFGRPCLLLAADEKRALCYFGLFCADLAYLSDGNNQDKKKTISAMGFANILWLFCDHPLQPNFWQTISVQAAEAISASRSGNDRVVTLFKEVQTRPIHRDVVESTARQKDFMRRIRADNGRGTRDRLAADGILLFSGAYDAKILKLIGLPPTGRSDFLSYTPTAPELLLLGGLKLPSSFKLAP